MAARLREDEDRGPVAVAGALEADKREGLRKVRIVSKCPVFLYGMRPVDEPGAPELAHLSLYELTRYWRVELAASPRRERELSAAASDAHQATSTETGLRKVREAAREKQAGSEGDPHSAAQLKAGVDYEIKEGGARCVGPIPRCARDGDSQKHVGVGAQRAPEKPEFSRSAATAARGWGRGQEWAAVDGVLSSVHAARRH